jgi:type I site-specific restriction endonuclease
MSVILRPYQTGAIEDLRAHLRNGTRRLLLVAPTGSGKGTMATYGPHRQWEGHDGNVYDPGG